MLHELRDLPEPNNFHRIQANPVQLVCSIVLASKVAINGRTGLAQ